MTARGYKTAFGFGEEVTFGTAVAPTKFLEISTEDLKKEQSAVPKPTLNRAGQRYYVNSKVSAGGPVSFPMVYQGAELLLEYATGGTPTSSQVAATTVYQHTFVMADSMKTGLTLYKENDAADVGTAWYYTGCHISSLTLTQDVEDFMNCTVEFTGRDQEKVTATTVTYPTFYGVQWTQNTLVQVDDGTTQTALQAKMTEFKIENALADDRYVLGTRLRKGIDRGGVRKVTGKIEIEFDDTTALDLFLDSTETAITANWVGPIADGAAETYKMGINLPRVVFNGTQPAAGDLGPISFELPFEAFIGTSAEDEITITLDNLLTSV